jgi:hypothetical protein
MDGKMDGERNSILLTIAIVVLAVFLWIFFYTIAQASPFVVSDPQEGVEKHEVSFPAVPYSTTIPAAPDGSLKFDLQDWSHGHGWFDGQVKAGHSYEVIDEATGNQTQVEEWGDPASFRLKVPNKKSASGYRISP